MGFRLCSVHDRPIQLITENRYSLKELEEKQGVFSERFYYLNAEKQDPRKYQDITTSAVLGNCHGVPAGFRNRMSPPGG